MPRIPIALATDENYAPYCATTIASILFNSENSTEFDFYILESGLLEKNKLKILDLKKIKNCTITFVNIDNKKFRKLPVYFHFSKEAYYRLNLPSILPDIDRILYLDCDMIILNDLSSVFDIDMDGCYAAMVQDYAASIESPGTLKRLQLPKGSRYYNSGFALFDLKKMRENGVEKKFFVWAEKNKFRILFVDQDVINAVMRDQIMELPEAWNMQMQYYRRLKKIPKVTENTCVIHYNGRKKPWKDKESPLASYFWKYFGFVKS